MANSLATKRLGREYSAIIKSPIPNITAMPLETNILEWHYVIQGTEGFVTYVHGQMIAGRRTRAAFTTAN